MTPARLGKVLAILNRSNRWLARQIGITEGAVRAWRRGEHPVPPAVAAWLDACAAAQRMLPPPPTSP